MTTWDNIVGHGWAVDLLRAGLHHGRTGHAYLFAGPDQIGKTTLARTFAQALNCTEPRPADIPCGICRHCRLIATDRHPDVPLLLPETSGRGKLTLKIDRIRELQHDLNLTPYEGRYKVAILKRFDAATPGAANAFLKTLEEPPRHVIMLLTAQDADMLLPTISSRCRTFTLRPLSTPQVMRTLSQRTTLSDERASLLAHLAGGRLGWALSAAEEPGLLLERENHLLHLQTALDGDRVARFVLAERLQKRPEELPPLLHSWLAWWRDLALLSWGNGSPEMITNIDRLADLQRLAGLWSREAVRHGLEHTNRALWQLERNANTRLLLENLLLHYPLGQAAGISP